MIWLLIWLVTNKISPIVTELLIRRGNLNISTVFITQSYFRVPKDVRLRSAHIFIIKFKNKPELQQITFNHSSDIGFEDFMNFYKICTAEQYTFLLIDTTLVSDNPLCFRRNLLERIWNLIMIHDDKVRDETVQCHIYREAAKISAFW